VERFHLLSMRSAAFKSQAPSPLGPEWFYRFSLDEESYPDGVAATARARALLEKPPKLSPDENKVFPLRNAFVSGARVYVVRTDVAAYTQMLDRLTRGLVAIQHAPDQAHRDQAADSLRSGLWPNP
jgi:hypothetical protein